MQIGIIGLGRMGANIARRLMKGGHQTVVYDIDAAARAKLGGEGAVPVGSLEAVVGQLSPPRIVWVMLPAGKITEGTIAHLASILAAGDVVIDGGNSYYKDDMRRAAELQKSAIHYIDVGTSGGVWGLARGYCMMIGGPEEQVRYLDPIFATLAPGIGDIAEVWRRGSVVSSWLLDLAAEALAKDSSLEGFSGYVEDSGEGRWTVEAAIEESVPAEVLTASLYTRFRSRQAHNFAEKMLSAMRFGFGGHVEKKRG